MSEISPSQQWLLVYFPFLQLHEPVAIGPWELRSSKHLQGMWNSPDVKKAATRFIGKHRTALGQRLDSMTIVTRDGRAVHSGPGPGDEELHALEAAMTCAVLAANPPWSPETESASWRISTSDNTVLRATWLDLSSQWFATERGSLVRTLSGGHRLDRPTDYIAAPLELHLPSSSRIDRDTAQAAYDTLLHGDPDLSTCLLTSIRWLAQAWANSPSIDSNIRIVAIRSGLEIWLDKQNAWDQARALRKRFERLTELFSGDSFATVWSPSESKSLEIEVGANLKPATPLEHWYVHLSRHRNATVHDAAEPAAETYEAGTGYDGPLFWTGERVLRDLLRTELTIATGEPLVFDGIGRALRRPGVLEELRAAPEADES